MEDDADIPLEDRSDFVINPDFCNRSKGHVSVMRCYLYRMYCQTPPTSLCSDNTQNLHRSTVERRIPKQCPHPRSNFNLLPTHTTLLILANRQRSGNGDGWTASCVSSFIKILVYHLHIVVPCNTTKECQIWNDGTYCAEGFENIKHTNKTCYCAMMSKLNRKTGACIGELGIIFGPLNIPVL